MRDDSSSRCGVELTVGVGRLGVRFSTRYIVAIYMRVELIGKCRVCVEWSWTWIGWLTECRCGVVYGTQKGISVTICE